MKKCYLVVIPIVILAILLFVVYKNKNEEVIQLDPNTEINSVESFIRSNIGTITPEKPVLGGSWYVTSISIDPQKNNGSVVYEDGHIQGSATFNYVISDDMSIVRVVDFSPIDRQ
jgi:hypothetical protein